MKYKWHVQEKPVGRYSSFEHRGFPGADYEDGSPAGVMYSESEYDPRDIKSGNYKPIKLRIADYSVTPWKWRTFVKRYNTIQEAKDAFDRIIKQHPEMMPKPKVMGLPKNLGF